MEEFRAKRASGLLEPCVSSYRSYMETRDPYEFDLDLVRKVILWARSGAPKGDAPETDNTRLCYHVHLMKEAGFLEAVTRRVPGQGSMWVYDMAIIQGLTFKGHEALRLMESEDFFNKAKRFAAEKALPWTLNTFVAVCMQYLGTLAK